jgi:uncharacterized protein (DUF4415 family)
MEFSWDVGKADANFKKHGVRFPESMSVFEDDYAITVMVEVSDTDELRFVSIGMGVKGRVLGLHQPWCQGANHFSPSCRATRKNAIRGNPMKQGYDFSKGKRGRVAPLDSEQGGKTRITIRLDEDLVDYFLKEAERSGGSTGYQTLINDALRQHVEGKAPKLEDTLRRIVREEIRAVS